MNDELFFLNFAVVYWFCCYDELRWEAPDREKGEDLGRMPRYAASRATDAIARKMEKIWGGCPGTLQLVQHMQSQRQAKNGEDLGRMPRCVGLPLVGSPEVGIPFAPRRRTAGRT